MKLSKGTVTALTADKPDCVVWDDTLPGFGVRIRAGKKSWLVQYRINGQQRREKLGDVRQVSLDDARSIARKRFAQIELGQDPAADRAAVKAKAASAKVTLARVADAYVDSRRGVVREKSIAEMNRYLKGTWEPLRDRPVDSVTRSDVSIILHGVTKDSGRVSSSRARSYLSAAFAWGMREGLCDSNPVVGTNVPDADVPSRDRILSDSELRLVWNACDDGDRSFDQIVRLLILLGCRRQEIGGLKWSEIDLDAGTLTIAGDRTKGGDTLELALPDAAIAILRSVPRRDSDFVFGATGFTSWSIAMAALRQRIAEPIEPPWTIHDLRRTFRSGLGRLGVPPHVAERLVGHAQGGVQAIYDRYSYRAEMANALIMWSEHVAAITEGRKRKVLALRSAL